MYKNKEITTSQEEPQVIELDAETLMQMMGEQGEVSEGEDKDFPIYFKEPLVFGDDQMTEIVNSDEYKEGLKLAAKLGGLYNGLVNLGMEERASREITLSQQAIEHQQALQKLINEGSEKVAKQNSLTLEKNMA